MIPLKNGRYWRLWRSKDLDPVKKGWNGHFDPIMIPFWAYVDPLLHILLHVCQGITHARSGRSFFAENASLNHHLKISRCGRLLRIIELLVHLV